MLRAATIADAAFISRVIIGSWRDAYADFLPPSFLASLDENPHHDTRSWERRISQPGSVIRIISDGGTNVGVVRLIVGASSIPGTDAQLTTLYLLSQARGHRLGSEALAFAWAEVSRQAAGRLGVCVLAGNKGGQRFYEQWGARRVGERVAFRLDDKPIMDILYRFGDRPLSEANPTRRASRANLRSPAWLASLADRLL
jgi:ribosomal protein S18 acetylase RimI-like enzyme